MISSGVFDYINVLDKAADASWTRNQIISNNIANVDTPNYKRQDVSFEEALQRELRTATENSLDEKVSRVSIDRLAADIYTDSAGYSYRMDGNNVDIDTENVELASNQIKYEALVDSMSQEFARIKSVLK
ncbi:flagellar basal body rod protein FlgB [Anaerobium acetethylicum]|uniref:Flagellar basal body rod protein FlgB n=1 Tax=Anaerobium acetethylicum TaxID=1619234 RepID=A0A1D3TQP2_9FIRM|nr:flagellar basal body rod protein FlgB [Anaerobium acetethylicum]SCP95942.1 flagellar basal-body rod protein FlgB [Anaerobium acetethylicum]